MGGGKKATDVDEDGASGEEAGGASGGGADGEGEPPASSLVPEVLCEYMKIPATGTEMTVMAKIRATVHQDESRRAPITICAAVDRSASMKDHLPLLKETLQFMVQQLRPEDKLSVITFDHEVRVELPLTRMDPAGKLQAERAIEGIKERGHTNLSGGLLAALEALYRVPSKDASLVESVLLFTDGKANVGIKDQATLVKATKSLLGQIGRQACVFTFGFGVEHDADLLRAVADAGNGLFYYIDNTDSIPESYCDCLGGLLSVAAQNVRLTITAKGEVHLSKPHTTFKTEEKETGREYEVTIPDIYCEEEKCILARLSVPANQSLTEAKNLALVSCHIAYFDVLNCRASEHTVECGVVRNNICSAPVHSDFADEIELHKLRCDVAEALGQANKLAESGNIRGAKDLLTRTSTRVRESIVGKRPLAVHLLHTLKESLEGLEDQVTFREHGKAVLQNYAGSHWQQRSSTQPTAVGYKKGKKRKAELRPAGGVHQLVPLPPPVPPGATPSGSPVSLTEVLSPYRNSSKMSLLVKHSKK